MAVKPEKDWTWGVGSILGLQRGQKRHGVKARIESHVQFTVSPQKHGEATLGTQQQPDVLRGKHQVLLEGVIVLEIR